MNEIKSNRSVIVITNEILLSKFAELLIEDAIELWEQDSYSSVYVRPDNFASVFVALIPIR